MVTNGEKKQFICISLHKILQNCFLFQLLKIRNNLIFYHLLCDLKDQKEHFSHLVIFHPWEMPHAGKQCNSFSAVQSKTGSEEKL